MQKTIDRLRKNSDSLSSRLEETKDKIAFFDELASGFMDYGKINDVRKHLYLKNVNYSGLSQEEFDKMFEGRHGYADSLLGARIHGRIGDNKGLAIQFSKVGGGKFSSIPKRSHMVCVGYEDFFKYDKTVSDIKGEVIINMAELVRKETGGAFVINLKDGSDPSVPGIMDGDFERNFCRKSVLIIPEYRHFLGCWGLRRVDEAWGGAFISHIEKIGDNARKEIESNDELNEIHQKYNVGKNKLKKKWKLSTCKVKKILSRLNKEVGFHTDSMELGFGNLSFANYNLMNLPSSKCKIGFE